MRALAADGAPEGLWLRAERQTGGRGRSGRAWVSPPGNFYASTLVRLRAGDPPAPTLALVAGLALFDAIAPFIRHSGVRRNDDLMLKWPNDLLVGARKLGGILLERVEAAVVIGIGVNLANHPADNDRPATSLARQGCMVPAPGEFAGDLASGFARALGRWRDDLAAIRTAWLTAAHPLGTALVTHGADGVAIAGTFDGLDATGACRLRLADGGVRLIHAGDLFLG